MRIWLEYTTPAAGNSPAAPGIVVLGDDALQEWIDGFLPSAQIVVQTARRLRADDVENHDRKNRQHTFNFTTHRQHASDEAALTFLRDHPTQATRGGLLRVRIGNRLAGYSSSVVQSVRAVYHSGSATAFAYTIQAGAKL